MKKKRLKKDLPFGPNGYTSKGTVIRLSDIGYAISYGNTYYEGGGTSDNGEQVYNNSESEIISKIWEDSDWFEDATLNHVNILVKNDTITINFDPLDAEDAEDLASAIQHYFKDVMGKEKSRYVWDELSGFTIFMKRNY